MRFLHIRNRHNNDPRYEVTTKGGVTVAYEVDDDTVDYAVALCSMRDNYCRKTGRSIAEGRFNAGKKQTVVLMEHNPIEVILRNLGEN